MSRGFKVRLRGIRAQRGHLQQLLTSASQVSLVKWSGKFFIPQNSGGKTHTKYCALDSAHYNRPKQDDSLTLQLTANLSNLKGKKTLKFH